MIKIDIMSKKISFAILLLSILTTIVAQFQGPQNFFADYSGFRKEAKPIEKGRNRDNQLGEGEKVYGVSLGGWLVLEPWIIPSLFEDVYEKTGEMPVDEYTYTAILGKRDARNTLEEHWSTFYTEEDFKEIADHGLNLVRIPIGYWAFGLLPDDPYVQGQEYYLDQAIQWADKHGLEVQIDIHGMPGSQNGFDNSGKRGGAPEWLVKKENKDLTIEVMEYFFDKYGDESISDIVTSLEIVNEPFAFVIDLNDLEEFYMTAYATARAKGVTANLYFHDGFLPISSWNWFMNDSSIFPNITIDHHLYEIFSEHQIALNIDQHIKNVEDQGRAMSHEPRNRIVGEFSGAITDCTKYINGVGMGARYDGTFANTKWVGSCANHTDYESWSDKFKDDTKRFIKAQFDTFEAKGDGWIFWCFKTENSIEWDFKRLASLDLLPDTFLDKPKIQKSKFVQKANATAKSQSTTTKTSNGYRTIDDSVLLFQKNFQLSKVVYILLFSFMLIMFATLHE